jgi:protein-L-isoaspartate O-methyltransferase
MILPIDTGRSFFGGQSLTRITKDADGTAHEENVLPVAFVPMV